MTHFIGTKTRWVLRILSALAIVWLLIALIWSSSNLMGIAASALGPWLFWFSLAVIFASIAARERWLTLVMAAMVLASSLIYRVAPSQMLPAMAGSGSSVKILQLNTLLDSASPTAVAEIAKRKRVDFAVLSETTAAFRPWHNHRLEAELPYHYSVDATYPNLGNTIYSRYPILHRWQIRGTANPTLVIQAKIGSELITLVGFRAANPLVNRATWSNDIHAVGAWVKHTVAGRQAIVSGDFNATFGQLPFDTFVAKTQLTDSAQAVNWAWNRNTFPTQPKNTPIMQIDHTLVPARFKVASTETIYVANSDHSATVSQFWFSSK